jgi:hypothetical protein
MGRRERLFLWLVLILAASLVVAAMSWLADELGWGGGGGRVGELAGHGVDRGTDHHVGVRGAPGGDRPGRFPQSLDAARQHPETALERVPQKWGPVLRQGHA